MSPESRKLRKNRIGDEAAHVRRVLAEWDPIPGSPKDEYDCLVDHIVSALHRGTDAADLARLIEVEFHSHFGLPVERESVFAVAETLSEWWGNPRHQSP